MNEYFVRKPVLTFVMANSIFYLAYSILVAELAPTKDSVSLQILTVFLYLISFLLVFVLPTTRKGRARILSGLEKKSYRAIYIVLPFLVAFSLATLLILILVLASLLGIIPIPLSSSTGQEMSALIPEMEVLPPVVILLKYLNVAVIAPIVEELGFRGVLFNALNRKKSVMFSLFISSLLFGAMHGENILTATFMGILLGYVYHITGDLRITIAAHMFNNFMVLSLPYLLPAMLEDTLLLNILVLGLAVLSVLMLGYFIILLRQEKAYFHIRSPLYRSGNDDSEENLWFDADDQASHSEAATSESMATRMAESQRPSLEDQEGNE